VTLWSTTAVPTKPLAPVKLTIPLSMETVPCVGSTSDTEPASIDGSVRALSTSASLSSTSTGTVTSSDTIAVSSTATGASLTGVTSMPTSPVSLRGETAATPMSTAALPNASVTV
jgi:hypothetical protein